MSSDCFLFFCSRICLIWWLVKRSQEVKVSKYNWSHGHASRNTVTVCWYKSFKICCCLLQLQWTQISICRGFVFCPLQPAKCATDRVYNKSTSTVWHFIFLPCKSNEALIDSLHWFNLASPGWNTALLSDGNLCVCVYWMWMYSTVWCGGGGSCWDGLLWVWLHALGRLHSGNRPPLSSVSIRTLSATSTPSARPNGA